MNTEARLTIDKNLVLNFDRLFPKDFQIDEDLICQICTDITQDPIECSKCQCLFCRTCKLAIDQSQLLQLNCINRCQAPQFGKPHKKYHQMLCLLKFDCINIVKGCQEKVTFENVRIHQNSECQFRQNDSPTCAGNSEAQLNFDENKFKFKISPKILPDGDTETPENNLSDNEKDFKGENSNSKQSQQKKQIEYEERKNNGESEQKTIGQDQKSSFDCEDDKQVTVMLHNIQSQIKSDVQVVNLDSITQESIIIHQMLPQSVLIQFIWFWQGDRPKVFNCFDLSIQQQLEQQFSQGNVNLQFQRDKIYYQINMQNSVHGVQKNLNTQFKRQILRLQKVQNQDYQWLWAKSATFHIPYISHINEKIEQTYQQINKQSKISQVKDQVIPYDIHGQKYIIDVVKMSQTNELTKFVRNIIRLDLQIN